MSKQQNSPKLIVVSAPSGAGKSTLTNKVIKRLSNVKMSISSTTRPKRGDEQHGREYYFLSQQKFFDKKDSGDLLEWAQVHGNYYGTSRSDVERMLDAGYNVLFDIDVQGAASLKEIYPDAMLVFIVPPSRAELSRRLKERKTDDMVEIEKRLRNAVGEMNEARHYEFCIINDDLEQATDYLEQIINGQSPDACSCKQVLEDLLEDFKHD